MKIARLQFAVMPIIYMLVAGACNVVAPAPTATSLPTLTRTPVPPTATFTPTLTPTPIPMASVNETVDCYAGPGAIYDKVASLEAGVQVQISGESSDQTYWIATIADGKECWLAKDALTTTTDEIAGLPQLIPPATPTLGPPTAPSELTVTNRCVPTNFGIEATFVINWIDNANNEEGYIIYKDGSEVKRLAANTTQYSDSKYGYGKPARYYGPLEAFAIAAFNAAGVSDRVVAQVQLKCPK